MSDLISRQAAIDAITAIDDGCNMDIFTNEVREILRDLPSVQERKNGRWVRKKDKKINAWWHSCSECGARPLKTLFGQYDALSVYCPNCGAHMEGAEE